MQVWLKVIRPQGSAKTIYRQSVQLLQLHRPHFPGVHNRMDVGQRSDLLDADYGLVAKDNPDRCLDRLLAHKAQLFTFLQARWRDLFGVTFDVRLYDLTSTYFESEPPFAQAHKRRFGYSRDHRPDCVPVVIALIVTPEGFPLAHEVLAGNTADHTTLRDFLAKIEKQYGKARRTWLMDRGIPTEDVLAQMRTSEPPVQYVVGTGLDAAGPTAPADHRQTGGVAVEQTCHTRRLIINDLPR